MAAPDEAPVPAEAPPPTTRVRVRFRHQHLPGRNTAGFRFTSAWSEVEATAEQLATLRADPHLVVMAPSPESPRPEALPLEELERRSSDPWKLLAIVEQRLANALAALAAAEARIAALTEPAAPAALASSAPVSIGVAAPSVPPAKPAKK